MVEKPIKMEFKIAGGKGSVIPLGDIETLLIYVRDGSATYHFKRAQTTKEFAKRQNQDGVKSRYVERIQTTICLYEGMKQDEIVKHISERIKALEAKP